MRELLGASGSGERGTPVLRRVLTMIKSQIGYQKEKETMMRTQRGDEHRKVAFLQDTISFAVAGLELGHRVI